MIRQGKGADLHRKGGLSDRDSVCFSCTLPGCQPGHPSCAWSFYNSKRRAAEADAQAQQETPPPEPQPTPKRAAPAPRQSTPTRPRGGNRNPGRTTRARSVQSNRS